VKTFKAIYVMEFRCLLNKKTMGLLLVFILLSLYLVQMGIKNYKTIIENKKEFQDFELLKVKQYINYGQYGAYGFRLLFLPSPLSVYFVNSSAITELTSNVDAGEKLNIYNSFKDRTLFAGKSGGFQDFSGIMLLLGSLLMLYFGYESMIHKDYLRFMAGFTSHRKLFISIVSSRGLIFILFFLFNTGLSLLLLKINDIVLSGNEYTYLVIYLGTLLLLMVFFFALGTIAGSLKSRFAGFVTIIAAWFALVFLVPSVVNTIISHRAEDIGSNHHLELEKLKTLMDFEKRAIKKAGFLNVNKRQTESERELIETYWKKEVKEIQAFEKKLEREMEKNIRRFQELSFLFPSTFYLATCNEISSKGYENFITFFDYIQKLKRKFVRFFIDKRYYSSHSEVESFVTGDENLFRAKTRLPGGFLKGVLLILAYIAVLFAISFVRFKKSVRL